MRWWLLGLACLVSLALFSAGCAARLVTVGRTYYVVWPGQPPDVVEIHGTRRDGWAACRSVTETVIWACNLNTLLFFVPVERAPHTPAAPAGGQRTD